MKNKSLIITVAIAICIAVSFLFFILQLRANRPLREELAQVRKEKDKAKRDTQYLDRLKTQSEQLDERIEALYRVVSLNEDKPLALIKELIHLSSEIGLEGVSFIIPSVSNESGPKKKTEKGVKRLPLQMEFEADFQQLVTFLEGISKMQRLVFPETIDIERSEKISPRQKIRLRLVTYTLDSSDLP
jgi:Tfp pilus assembly protein PilO